MKLSSAVFALSAALVLSAATGGQAAEMKKLEPPPKVVAKAGQETAPAGKGQLATEAQYSQWLVQVLALSRFVSPQPSPQECFAVLLLNGISPKNGWNATSVVSRATLARTVVQAMGRQGEVKNQNDDASWINYLKEIGVEIPTMGQALNELEPLDAPLGNEAVSVSTDPLGKTHRIRPVDEQQLGADLSDIRRVLVQLEDAGPPPEPPGPPPPPRPPRGDEPDDEGPEQTPN